MFNESNFHNIFDIFKQLSELEKLKKEKDTFVAISLEKTIKDSISELCNYVLINNSWSLRYPFQEALTNSDLISHDVMLVPACEDLFLLYCEETNFRFCSNYPGDILESSRLMILKSEQLTKCFESFREKNADYDVFSSIYFLSLFTNCLESNLLSKDEEIEITVNQTYIYLSARSVKKIFDYIIDLKIPIDIKECLFRIEALQFCINSESEFLKNCSEPSLFLLK